MSERLQAEKEISRLHRYESLFNTVATEFAISQDVGRSIQYTVRTVGEEFRAERVIISPNSQSLVVKGEWNSLDISECNCFNNLIAKRLPFLWQNVMAANMIKVHNVDVLPEPDRSTLLELGVKSLIGLPIIGEQSPWGVLCPGN